LPIASQPIKLPYERTGYPQSNTIGAFAGLVIFSVICCAVGGGGITSGMKDQGLRFFLAFLLTGFFLFANIFIAVLIGCSQMGRI
jgi:hypothetical protein